MTIEQIFEYWENINYRIESSMIRFCSHLSPKTKYSVRAGGLASNSLMKTVLLMVFLAQGLLSPLYAQTRISLDGDIDYSSGMAAYIEQNFSSAQSHWLRSAERNNAKAMFNLGLLHEQNKLPDSDPAKAERWFNLSGQNGYPAADYHFAKQLLGKGNKMQAQLYMKRAAKNGSAPAKLYFGEPLTDYLVNREAKTRRSAQQQLSEPQTQKQYLAEQWILEKPKAHWTIQLLAFKEERKVRDFIERHNLHDQAAYFKENNSTGLLYKLVYGAYNDKTLADSARKNLSASLQQHGPWLRSLASVQAVISGT